MTKVLTAISILIFFAFGKGFGQTESNTIMFKGVSFHCYTIKIDNQNTANFAIIENSLGLVHKQIIDSINTDEVFCVVASIVDLNCLPLGYYCSSGNVVKPVNLADGDGNFYLKPNGALLILRNSVVICESSQIQSFTNVQFGIQSGPMLINGGVINSNFSPNSNNKYIRAGVGMYENNSSEKFLVFALSDTPVSFYDFSDFFLSRLDCNDALCLESDRSVMSIPYLSNSSDLSEDFICRYIVYMN